MLDTFEIVTTSGVVLWSRSYAPVNHSVINNFIADTFIEEKGASTALRSTQSAASNPAYKTDHHTLKWAMVKELGVIFVVCSILSLRCGYNHLIKPTGRLPLPPTSELGR